MDRVNLLVLIEQLESLIERAPEVPLTGKVLINTDELFDLIDIIRVAIPEEVKRAEVVSSEKEKLIKEGKAQAERLVAKAEEYATQLVSTSEIHRQAQEESEAILEESNQRAKEIREGAKDYAMQIFSNLQEALEKTLNVVEKSKEELKSGD
ncbi:MAG: ATPase [Bacillota bacterium]|nr:ATPase [Bacillota bacterium]HHU61565.1 ATPase [Natronincola sp.]